MQIMLRPPWMACVLLILSPAADAQDLSVCRSMATDAERLACYDGAAAMQAAPGAPLRAMSGSGSNFAFRNCAEARAAGAAPVRIGEPGYSRRLDRDGDGIGCE
jgi:hypothetical protein